MDASRGSLSYIAAHEAYEIARDREDFGKQQKLAEADANIRRLALHLARLAPELEAFKRRPSNCAS